MSPNKQLVAGGSALTAAMIVAGGGNYLANLALGRMLSPAEFGDAALMVTFMLASTVLTGGVQLFAAKAAAEESVGVSSNLESLRSNSLVFASVLALVLVALSPRLSATFNLGSAWLIPFMAFGLPFHLALAVDRGLLQGRLALTALAKTLLAEVTIRLFATVGLVALGTGALGATIAINLAFVGCLPVSRFLVKTSAGESTTSSGATSAPESTRSWRSAAMVAVLSVGTVVISNGDLVAAKVLLNPTDAGRYALVGLVGRVIYMVAVSLHGTMIPLMIQTPQAQRAKLKNRCALAVGSVSLFATVLIWSLDNQIASLIGGSEGLAAAGLLGPYALAAALFTISSTSATLDLAVDKNIGAQLILAAATLQSGLLIVGNPTSGAQIVAIQIATMAVLLIGIEIGNKVEHSVIKTSRSKPWQLTNSMISSS